MIGLQTASVLIVVALSGFQPTVALRSMQPVSVVAKGVTSILPLCSSVKPGSLHIGDACLSDCDGSCRASAARPGFRLIPDNEQPVYSQGCGATEGRRICAVGVSNPGGYPLCEELDTETCSFGCKCWSTCTDHICNPDALYPGYFFIPNPQVITPSGCLIDLQRHLCSAGAAGQPTDFWISVFVILLLAAAATGIYYLYR